MNVMKKIVKLTESDLFRIVKRVIKEEYGRPYSIESLYDVIKDELINDQDVQDWIKFTESMGALNDFMVDDDGVGIADRAELRGDTLGVTGNVSILSATILPILVRLGVTNRKKLKSNPDEMDMVNHIAELLYSDIKPDYNPHGDF